MKIKKIIATAMLGIVFAAMGLPCGQVNALAATSLTVGIPTFEKQEGASVYASKTEWKYRTKNGKMQRRLWSNTEKKWLTDWQYI